MIDISTYINDHPGYIKNIVKIIRDRIEIWSPSDVYITRIDNWFDNKWVKFSGTLMHEISIWKDEPTVPPFHPNRVESCDIYKKIESEYEKALITKPLHVFQESSSNIKRNITDFSDNGLFIWFSGNTLTNGRGSLMGYFVAATDCFTFYLSLAATNDWKTDKIIGLTKKKLKKC
jgi:hypothetical protein